MENYCIKEDKAHELEPELAPEDQPLPWDAWDDFIDKMEEHGRSHAQDVKVALASCGQSSSGGGCEPAAARDVVSGVIAAPARRAKGAIPAMPTIPYKPEHRPKLKQRIPHNCCVARPVTRREQREKPKARDAMKDEWNRLRKLGTWDDYVVREWSEVAKEARLKK